MTSSLSSQRDKINLKTLQRIDPFVSKIVHTASEAALYEYVSTKWVKSDMEGVFFVYSRRAEPKHGFIMLNKNSVNNLIEPITKELDFQLQEPFVLYKTKDKKIFGIWFSEQRNCPLVFDLVSDLIRQAKEGNASSNNSNGVRKAAAESGMSTLEALMGKANVVATKDNKKNNQEDNGGGSLMSLLRSGEKQKQQKSASASKPEKKQRGQQQQQQQQQQQPRQPPNGSSVDAFFAQASGTGASAVTPTLATGTAGPMQMMPQGGFLPADHQLPAPTALMPPPGTVPAPPAASTLGSDDNGALQRLLTNPSVHSLEDLERQQRMESISPNALPNVPRSATNLEDLENQLKQEQKPVISYAAATNKPQGNSNHTSKKNNAKNNGNNNAVTKPMLLSPGSLERTVVNNTNGTAHAPQQTQQKPQRQQQQAPLQQQQQHQQSQQQQVPPPQQQQQPQQQHMNGAPPPGLVPMMMLPGAVMPPRMPVMAAPLPPHVMEAMVADERQNPQKYVLAREQFENMFRYLLSTDPGFVDLLHGTYIKQITQQQQPQQMLPPQMQMQQMPPQ